MNAAALDYAARGFAVFPIVARSKAPRVSGGFKTATPDAEIVSRWWRRWPQSNVGIATGAVSGLVVLDIDPRNNGDDSLAELLDEVGGCPDAPRVHTGGDGLHIYFRHPLDAPIPCRTNAGGRPGIDVKGDGGYVVAPPSIHPNGRAYAWDLLEDLEQVRLPEAPDWLLELARGGKDWKRQTYVATAWDGRIPDRVAYAAAVSGKVARRFHRDPAGLVDASPSGVDFSLACLLARFSVPGGEIEAGIRASRARAHPAIPERPPSYFRSTIEKALALAREEAGHGR